MTLKDTSKYGTFVNGQRMTENTTVGLKSGDQVTFGAFNSKFRCEMATNSGPFCFCNSIKIKISTCITFPCSAVFPPSLVFLKPVVCSSCLDNGDKASLSSALQSLGGKLVNSWTQDCTHLVMNTVKVTIKVLTSP